MESFFWSVNITLYKIHIFKCYSYLIEEKQIQNKYIIIINYILMTYCTLLDENRSIVSFFVLIVFTGDTKTWSPTLMNLSNLLQYSTLKSHTEWCSSSGHVEPHGVLTASVAVSVECGVHVLVDWRITITTNCSKLSNHILVDTPQPTTNEVTTGPAGRV